MLVLGGGGQDDLAAPGGGGQVPGVAGELPQAQVAQPDARRAGDEVVVRRLPVRAGRFPSRRGNREPAGSGLLKKDADTSGAGKQGVRKPRSAADTPKAARSVISRAAPGASDAAAAQGRFLSRPIQTRVVGRGASARAVQQLAGSLLQIGDQDTGDVRRMFSRHGRHRQWPGRAAGVDVAGVDVARQQPCKRCPRGVIVSAQEVGYLA